MASKPTLYGFTKSQDGRPVSPSLLNPLTPRTLGWAKAAAEAYNRQNVHGDWNRFSYGATETLVVRAVFGAAGSVEERFAHRRLPRGAKRFGMDGLPESFLAEFKKELASARTHYRDAAQGRPPTARPPQ